MRAEYLDVTVARHNSSEDDFQAMPRRVGCCFERYQPDQKSDGTPLKDRSNHGMLLQPLLVFMAINTGKVYKFYEMNS